MNFTDVDKLMHSGVDDGVFPGAVILVSVDNHLLFFESYGYADLFTRAAMTRDTLFDLASLTKPLATSLAIMKLIERGKLDLRQPLHTVISEFKTTDKADIGIHHLLHHNSGLPAYRPYYQNISGGAPADRKRALRNLLLKEPLISPVGGQVLYSDLGFMVLEWVVEHVSGERLDRFVRQEIYDPLAIQQLFFIDLAAVAPVGPYATTEKCPWRSRFLTAEVHDENAHATGGIAGHAGLFGNAEHVHKLLMALMAAYRGQNICPVFKQDLVKIFFKRRAGTDTALGFDTPSQTGSSSGTSFSGNSVGHLGFTGTSFWMDLDRYITVILLTNRVHPTRENDAIKRFRPILHDTVMDIVSASA